MPILTSEPQVFPDDLFTAEKPASAGDRAWWLLHTRPRQEKSLAREFHAAKIPYYLPQIPHRVRVRNRMLTSHIPLFSGYVFLLASAEERPGALASTRVANCIEVADQAGLTHDLLQVYRLLATQAEVAVETRLVPGVIVEIQSGPLAGMRGKIVQEANRKRFIVQVDLIQRGASVMLDGAALMPVAD